MIDVAVLVVIVLITVTLTLMSVGLGYALGRHSTTAPYDPYARSKAIRDDLDAQHEGLWNSTTITTYEKPEDEPEPEEHATLPVDPLNPPSWRTYAPKRPDAEPKFCLCHHEEIPHGAKVLWWPNPETKGVDLLCEKGVAEAESLKDIL